MINSFQFGKTLCNFWILFMMDIRFISREIDKKGVSVDENRQVRIYMERYFVRCIRIHWICVVPLLFYPCINNIHIKTPIEIFSSVGAFLFDIFIQFRCLR